jgi:NAD/NADP transhydrogenase alpha subunit
MIVGVPREIKKHEYRVGLTPGAAREYMRRATLCSLRAAPETELGRKTRHTSASAPA